MRIKRESVENKLLRHLIETSKANWRSDMKPSDFKDFESYQKFFIQSYLSAFKMGQWSKIGVTVKRKGGFMVSFEQE